MNPLFPLSLAIFPNFTSWKTANYREVSRQAIQTQQQLIRYLQRISSDLVISIRYIYDPTHSNKVQTYLLANSSSLYQSNDQHDELNSILTKGSFSNFYTANHVNQNSSIQQLNWVQFVGEVYKYEEFNQFNNLYLPYQIQSLPNNDMQAVYDDIHRLDNKFILDITLQTVPQNQLWCNAVNQMIAQLQEVRSNSSQDVNIDITLRLYREYQRLYLHGDIFKFSIKALAERKSDASLVLQTLIEHATETTDHGKQCPIAFTTRGKRRFQDILTATEEIQLPPLPEWQSWQKEFGQKRIQDAIKVTKVKKGLDLFDDGSLSLDRITGVANQEQRNLPYTNSSDIVPSGTSFLSKFSSAPQQARIEHLKPLSNLATTEEITGFFRFPIPTLEQIKIETKPKNYLPDMIELEDIIREYSHLITEDSFVVGIDQRGNLCISDFRHIPHRLIAGVTRMGKTNFIKSVIYQFLYANPKRDIWIADFKGGMDYQLIADLDIGLRMVTNFDEFAKLLGELWNEHEERQELMRANRVNTLYKLKEKTGVKKDRKLMIIDEGAAILSAGRAIKAEINNHLANLAARSAATGIHLIYCAQRPTPEVVPRLISDNMDERVIFKVQSGASGLLLNNDIAESLPVKPKGRAIYKGDDSELKLVATPYVCDEIWENSL